MPMNRYILQELQGISAGNFTTKTLHPGVIHAGEALVNEYGEEIDHFYWYLGGGATHALLAEIERHRDRADTRHIRSVLGALELMKAIALGRYRVEARVGETIFEGDDISVINWHEYSYQEAMSISS
jgi:hypothetical protein